MMNQSLLWTIGISLLALLTCTAEGHRVVQEKKVTADKLAPPVEDGPWIRPAMGKPAQPIWGHKDGLRVGLWPMWGPKGLLRIYTPYAGQTGERMINFIAVEPIVDKARGLSEIEKRMMWSGDDDKDALAKDPTNPTAGKIVDGNLTVFIFVETLQNGAKPYLQLTFYRDRPYEVGLKVFAQKDFKEMSSCVVTATMGNYARCRKLWLKDEVVASTVLYKNHQGDGFTRHTEWPLDKILQRKDGAVAAITPDEADPAKAIYAKDVPEWWRFQGRLTTQYWRKSNPHPSLKVRVNARKMYWASKAEIPGGVSYENFEFEEPFASGQEFFFGVTLKTPKELGW